MAGFIGLGRMGEHIAQHIIKAGYPLHVYDIVRPKMDATVALGGIPAESAADVGKASEITFLCLPHPKISEEVILGPTGLLQASAPGSVIVELSTIPPSLVHKLNAAANERDISFVDAGLAGGTRNVVTGTSTVMAGGTPEAFERVLPLFRAFAKYIYYVGPSGAGMSLKVAHNAIVHSVWVATCEGVAMAMAAGIRPETICEVISNGTGNTTVLDVKYRRKVLKGDFEPGMTVDLAYKDSLLAMETASELGVPLFVTLASHGIYEWARAKKLGSKDFAVLFTFWEELLGVKAREG